MKTIDLGKVCQIIRKRRNISQEKLIYGLCKQSTYSHFETNEIEIPFNISERLLQRLGLSSSNFLFLITESEFEYQEWKANIIHFIHEKEYNKALELLSSDHHPYDNIQQQFYLFIHGYLTDNIAEMEEALFITLPRINNIYFQEMAISAEEMIMLLCYWKKKGDLLKRPDILKGCIEYTDLYYIDKEKVKLLTYELNVLNQIPCK
ncbi:MAG: helix-turn-helix transcriptional regulator, partial [Lachnospiraceae bacterium]|nr:helix-turn-helix transcriptional regulator [Lachnospiraceae bacterium]